MSNNLPKPDSSSAFDNPACAALGPFLARSGPSRRSLRSGDNNARRSLLWTLQQLWYRAKHREVTFVASDVSVTNVNAEPLQSGSPFPNPKAGIVEGHVAGPVHTHTVLRGYDAQRALPVPYGTRHSRAASTG